MTTDAQTSYTKDDDTAPSIQKTVRASIACEECRSRKRKCGTARPCQFCTDNSLTCKYEDVQPPKKNKVMNDIQQTVDNISLALSQLVDPFKNLQSSVEGRLLLSTEASSPGEHGTSAIRSGATGTIPKEQQIGRTTPAHKLLNEWPQMRIVYQGIPYLRWLIDDGREVSDYPMQLEQDRGLLRVWGVGEGQDLNDGVEGLGSSSGSKADITTPSKEGLWGYPFFEAPSTSPDNTPRQYPFQKPQSQHENGLGADGGLDFGYYVMLDLLESYLRTMHTFHPFMNETELRNIFQGFSNQYSPDMKPLNAHSPTPVHGVKRRRSGSNLDGLPTTRGEIERSLPNAIVLLVLALGKVCSHTDPLPAPQNDRHHSETSDESRPRNIELLPGMAYYARATDILGNQQGGNTIAHAQAMLLAALFLSQYARVLESWSWINNACRIALVLIKTDSNKLLRVNSATGDTWSVKERHRFKLVYCAVLQLESDIIAEMSALLPSDISAHESEIIYPKGVNQNWSQDQDSNFIPQEVKVRADPRKDLIMKLYSAQTFLRVALNDAQNALYSPSSRMSFNHSFSEVSHHALAHMKILEDWREELPPELAWSDVEYPSTDLNIARVRAKYYGGLYMMLRPCLRHATHTLEFPAPPPGTICASRHNPSAEQQDIIDIAINAAIQSTIAFDRVGEEPGSTYHYFKPTRKKRLIVTDIFGTLHAQFGNMLVLACVYKSKLYPLLPSNTWLTKANLAALFKRTIDVISEVAQNSPILSMDLKILRNVQEQQGLVSDG